MLRELTFPKSYLDRPDAELSAAIRAIKNERGADLTILGHHYQNDGVVDLADFTGDSFKLCRDAAAATARYIVFCGVRFMAESARVLARPDQVVQHPEPTALCPMAEMANLRQVQEAWEVLTRLQSGRRIIPVTYMNSNADLKAFCGRHGGVVCTSSNASRVFDWAYGQGDTILFLPDEHLGRNTANQRGMARDLVQVWDPRRAAQAEPDPGRARDLARARLVLWKGFCHVHTEFTVDHVRDARRRYPGCFVIVHPECPEEVVAECDATGSTEAIVRRVAEAKPGETIVIGTEINLVARLADQHPNLTVVPLAISSCPNMAKITLGHLLWTLENLGRANVVEVDPAIAADARTALRRMLELG